ncbi:pyridoxamine 5'-phosphate oxidase family protein [Mesobacillus maritimus]|uniref:pyridoxamine 5'-phosphate oxidase family protein n=1 Tax=Mesobacillus maritimus TaxID=1643336 RepID=UPI002041A0B8|nr:pyridoxamine 5'-phosphate oxidase family protein [Mesobacillus maritimus]MCM3587047.1 pyridoxamine 5'-phosphate oxidase family protein [Mesobacillus maritimus]MCM3667612.1 pyridoxamine 5'-phosphate oxidase family protein [Mesobacillus maritimus]
MANEVEPQLISELFEELQTERFVTIATVDHETGGPNVSAISWIFAQNAKTIYFAIDNRSRIIENLKQNGKVVIALVANESTYSISGTTTIKQDAIPNVPLSLSLVEMHIEEVRDVMFYGSKIVSEPTYDKTYDKEAAARLDKQVMDAIRKA